MEKKIGLSPLHINLLGNPNISFGNGTAIQLPPKKLALLAYLALEHQAIQRSKLILLFWSDVTDSQARNSLRTTLSELRRVIGDYLQPTRQMVSLNWEQPILLDALELETAFTNEPLDLERLVKAISFYRGSCLTGLEVKNAPEFADWVLSQQDHYQKIALEGLDKLIRSAEDQKNYSKALDYAQNRLNFDQLQEKSHYKVIRLYAELGNRVAALQQYEKCRQVLAENLQIEPSGTIKSLIAQIESGKLGQLSQTSKVQSSVNSSINLSSLPKNLTLPAFLTKEIGKRENTLFVGRAEELNQLQEALDSITKGKGQARLVLGSAGQGKSYLLQKFAKHALEANKELLILIGYCDQQSGIGDPYLPFRHTLLMLLGDVESQWQGGLISTAHAKLLWKAMGEIVPEVAKYAPDLISSFLTGMPLIERLMVAGLDKEPWFEEVTHLASAKPLGTLEQTRIISLYVSALQAIAKTRPILLILEDLHWVDASSAALFNYLSRHIAQSRILLVGSYRSSDVLAKETHPILDISNELQRLYGNIKINLEEQKIEDEREFVNAYLDSESNELDSNFREVFFKHTQGHALFIAELLSAMKERGDLYKENGKWFAKGVIDWQTLPEKVEGVIKLRISRLLKEQRELLSVASVQGEAFVGEAVAQVQKQNEREVIKAFSNEMDKRHRLVKSERMERLGKQRLSHYRFRHNLFQQYMYRNLTKTERAYLHEDIALALEEMYGKQVRSIAPQLAWHFEEAGNLDKTLEYLLAAGQQAQMLSSHREAIIHYERGLTLVNQLPVTPEFISLELSFQAGLGTAFLSVEGFLSKRVKVALERALELCRQTGGVNSQLLTIYSGLGFYALCNSDCPMQTFLDWSIESNVLANQQGDLAHLASSGTKLTAAHFYLGDNDKAVEIGRESLNHVNFDQASHENMIRHYNHDPRVMLMPILSWALCFKGKIKEIKTLMAKELLSDLKHSSSKAVFLSSLCPFYSFMNDFAQLKSTAEELLKLANEYGYAFWKAWGLINHGWAIAKLGQVEKGVTEMQQGMTINRVSGGLVMGPYSLAMLAEGLWLMDKQDNALNTLEEAFIYSKKRGELFYLSQLNRLKGEWLKELGAESDQVEQYFKQAIVLAKEQNAPMIELQATLSLAKYWQANNKEVKMHSLLTELLDRITPVVDLDEIPEYREVSKIITTLDSEGHLTCL